MRGKNLYPVLWVLLAVSAMPLLADQIKLKNGAEYSGKFVRADASVVEFRILGRIESFKTSEVSQIIFKEPELQPRQEGRVLTNITPRDPPLVPPSPVPGPSATFPEGTSITIRTTSDIDTDRNRTGDSFTATLEDALVMGSQVIMPAGSEVRGVITESKESGRIAGKSELALELTEITSWERTYVLRTGEYSEVGSSRGNRTAKTAGGAAALGAIIGAISGGGKGAAIGAAAGATTGVGIQVLTRGETLRVPSETILEFKLRAPLTLPVP